MKFFHCKKVIDDDDDDDDGGDDEEYQQIITRAFNKSKESLRINVKHEYKFHLRGKEGRERCG